MITHKNSAFYLSFIAILALGLIAGYSLGNIKSSVTKTIYVNSPLNSCTSTFPANNNVIKTDLTAKEAFVQASSEAILWAKDAYISEINLSSQNFNSDGASNGWKITFYSKEKKRIYEILIKDGESRGGEEKDAAKSIQTLKGEMTDSAILAKSFFGLYPSGTEIISLKMYYDTSAKKFLWTVFFPKGSHTIDAEI